MLPEPVKQIKEKIGLFIQSPKIDRANAKSICDDVLAYCNQERDNITNFKTGEQDYPHFEGAVTTMQLVYNMVADDTFYFEKYSKLDDDRFERYGFKSALQELEEAETKGLSNPQGDPWKEWEESCPDWLKNLSQDEEMTKLNEDMMKEIELFHFLSMFKKH